MSAAPPTILPILATPLGITLIPGAAALNPEVAAVFARQIAADEATRVDALVHRSRDDFFERPEPPLRELAEAMLRGVYAVVSSVNELTDAQWRSFVPEVRGWLTRVRTDGCVPAANYPLTSWCAVYCISAPAVPVTRTDSGVLRLYESRLGTMFQDATNSTLRIPFQTAHYSWRPAPGKMVVFPASVTHEIALLRSPGELLLVTARVRFVAPGQQGMGRW